MRGTLNSCKFSVPRRGTPNLHELGVPRPKRGTPNSCTHAWDTVILHAGGQEFSVPRKTYPPTKSRAKRGWGVGEDVQKTFFCKEASFFT